MTLLKYFLNILVAKDIIFRKSKNGTSYYKLFKWIDHLKDYY